MACYHPRAAYRPPGGGQLAFTYHRSHTPTEIRCGNCIGCTLDDARDWATRCMHEARMHKHNCFVTLTYNDEHLPKTPSLDHRDFQLFIKKLRERATDLPPAPKGGGSGGEIKIYTSAWYINNGPRKGARVAPYTAMARPALRYHMCGEYGPTNGRQHFHANIFGINFADKKYWKKTPAGYDLYKSETLDNIWGNGYASIGELTWRTAAYTARYNTKKAGEKNEKWEIINPDTGEIIIREPEYQKMSRNPGLGKPFLEQYYTDVYPHGTVIINARENAPPRYYDEFFKLVDEQGYNALKSKRHATAANNADAHDLTRNRNDAKERVAKAKLDFLKRNGDFEI